MLDVKYYYDTILGRNVYGIMPNEEEVEMMECIANMYKKLSNASKEYITVRLEMLKGDISE